jgi:hypothetical protein
MNDIIASKLSLMGIDRFMLLGNIPLVFFKMMVSGQVGLIILADHDLTVANMQLFKKMIMAFGAKLQSSSNAEFEHDYVWIMGSGIANQLSGNSFDINKWLSGKHMAFGKQLFVYPALAELVVNSSYKSFVWRSFSEYIK